jgi:hypothetical protein
MIKSNSAYTGGGVSGGSLTNCLLSGNRAAALGGGADRAVLYNCTLRQNTGYMGGGANRCQLYGCLVVSNQASYGGGIYDLQLVLEGCTVVGNSAYQYGGVKLNGFSAYNSIVYYNSATIAPNYEIDDLAYCCTVPLPSGQGNITNQPLFVDVAGGDYHLSPNSPCINSGRNASIYGTTTDLDGGPRIVSGTVDMGAFEYQDSGSLISSAWLQQYGWPTDGSADFLDADGDGMNNWQEWRADTIPTNALSALTMVTVTNGTPGLQVTWQSVATRRYWLERATNLGSSPAFWAVTTNIAGQLGSTSYTDTRATNGGCFLYRVGVQP